MNQLTYHLPLSLAVRYQDRRMVLIAETTQELVEHWRPELSCQVAYVRIRAPQGGAATRLPEDAAFPLDLYLHDPPAELATLYEYSPLLRNRALRVSLPLVPGFGKAVKLAAALRYAVRLLPVQPEESLRQELLEVLAFYLHHHSVQEPIEFFQGVLNAFFHDGSLTIWQVLEEDPAQNCFVAPDGQETPGQRLRWLPRATPAEELISLHLQTLLAEGRECAACEFQQICRGYFKWPKRDYSCHAPRAVFAALQQAARELAADVEGVGCPKEPD